MGTEVKTLWIPHGGNLSQVANLIDEGWELVQWQPIINAVRRESHGPLERTTDQFDAFLLVKEGEADPN